VDPAEERKRKRGRKGFSRCNHLKNMTGSRQRNGKASLERNLRKQSGKHAEGGGHHLH